MGLNTRRFPNSIFPNSPSSVRIWKYGDIYSAGRTGGGSLLWSGTDEIYKRPKNYKEYQADKRFDILGVIHGSHLLKTLWLTLLFPRTQEPIPGVRRYYPSLFCTRRTEQAGSFSRRGSSRSSHALLLWIHKKTKQFTLFYSGSTRKRSNLVRAQAPAFSRHLLRRRDTTDSRCKLAHRQHITI